MGELKVQQLPLLSCITVVVGQVHLQVEYTNGTEFNICHWLLNFKLRERIKSL